MQTDGKLKEMMKLLTPSGQAKDMMQNVWLGDFWLDSVTNESDIRIVEEPETSLYPDLGDFLHRCTLSGIAHNSHQGETG